MTADQAKTPVAGRALRAVIVVVVGVLLWWLPGPGGLTPQAGQLLAIFVATIVGLILQPLPQGAVVLIGVSVSALAGTLPLGDALSGYSDSTVWLIVTAFLLARGFIKTGLGRRIAFHLVRSFGRSTLGLAYALTLADLAIAPATPSNTARAGGILFPIVRSLASCLGSEPGPTARRAGAFLIFNGFQVNLVTSALFLTSVAPNAMIVKLAREQLDFPITWASWALAALVPGLISLALLPLLIYRCLRPETTRTDEAVRMARRELEQMGSMDAGQQRMLVVFLLTLALWGTGQWTGLSATAVALTGVCALLISGVLGWDDVVGERGAWDALIWFGGLVSLTSGLGKLGVIGVLADFFGTLLGGFGSWLPAFLLLVLAYVYLHYFVASMTAHAAALYVPMALVGISLGAPVALVAMVLGFMNSLNAAMTTYGTGPSPIYFGAGYVDPATWWKYGFLISLFHLLIWLGLGGIWWKVIGLW